MPFIPHTRGDVEAMLGVLGVETIDDLFDEIPDSLRIDGLAGVPPGESEQAVARRMRGLAARDGTPLCFAGAGAYAHHIPAAVWQIATRGEFYSAYTPYQAEASQGTLQVIYEYQTMMASLTGMDVSNASLYDGASALAEAVLMALRANRKNKSTRVILPATVHPVYLAVLRALVGPQDVEIVIVPRTDDGTCDVDAARAACADGAAVLVIGSPNFFGRIEDVDTLTELAHEHDAFAVAVVNPTSLALLRPPGEWGSTGVDIVCGEGQPLGVPLSSGGPYFGFLCCRQAVVRQMPGRLVGRTEDLDGKPGFALTLQAREQHIRRAKATSNICTNQGLMVTAATIYLSLLGPTGLRNVAARCHAQLTKLVAALAEIDGVESVFPDFHFHESVIRLPVSPRLALERLAGADIVGGVALDTWFPDLQDCLLVCATEVTEDEDITAYADRLRAIVADA